MKKTSTTYVLKQSTFFIAFSVLVALYFCSCNKNDDEIEKSSKVSLEKLGDMPITGFTYFDFSGDPVVYIGGYFYQWQSNTKEWKKIGKYLMDNLKYFVEDDNGHFYTINTNGFSNNLLTLDSNNVWTPVDAPAITSDIRVKLVFGNSNGDVVAIGEKQSVNGSQIFYFKKNATQTNWVQINVVDVNTWSTGTYTPSYLSDNGYLFFDFDDGTYQGGAYGLTYKVLDIQTGEFKKLWDETEPANILMGLKLQDVQIEPDGSIYCWKWDITASQIKTLYKLSINNLPAKFEKVQSYTIPVEYEGTKLNVRNFGYSIDKEGDIRFALNCEKNYYAELWAYGIANIHSSDFKVLDFPLTQERWLISNRKNESFVKFTTSTSYDLYKWK